MGFIKLAILLHVNCLYVNLLPNCLSVQSIVTLVFKQTFCLVDFPLQLHLELCMTLSTSFDHFLKTFFAMVSVFLVSCTNGVFIYFLKLLFLIDWKWCNGKCLPPKQHVVGLSLRINLSQNIRVSVSMRQ